MAEKYLKLMIVLFVGFGIVTMCIGILDDGDSNYNVSVSQSATAADGLNLKAVGELLKEASTAEAFEKLINDPSKAVNNLDLNEDGKVDFINVTEFGEGNNRGFSLTTDVTPGETQEVATINIEKAADGKAEVQTTGNPNIYGNNHTYSSSWSPGFGSGLLMGYLFSNHGAYRSPYYGNYPSGYQPYQSVPNSTYQNNTQKYTGSSTAKAGRNSKMLSPSKSPMAGKSASSIKAPLSSPTSSQKSFQSRNPSKRVSSGGFGRTKSPSSSSSSVRSSSRSGGSFRGK